MSRHRIHGVDVTVAVWQVNKPMVAHCVDRAVTYLQDMPHDRFLKALAAWDAMRAGTASGAHYAVAIDVLSELSKEALPPSLKRIAWRPVISVHSVD